MYAQSIGIGDSIAERNSGGTARIDCGDGGFWNSEADRTSVTTLRFVNAIYRVHPGESRAAWNWFPDWSSAEPGCRHDVAGVAVFRSALNAFATIPDRAGAAGWIDRAHCSGADRAQKLDSGPKNCHSRQPLSGLGVTDDSCFDWSTGLAMQSFGSLTVTSDDSSFFDGSNAVTLMRRRSRFVLDMMDISEMSRRTDRGKSSTEIVNIGEILGRIRGDLSNDAI